MRAVFLGNHTVGVTVMRVLAELDVLAGVAAHPEDPEDGVRYLSVHSEALKLKVPTLRARGTDPALEQFVSACLPDVLVVADYRYLLPQSVLRCARHGGINFHPSLLPAYRGRAPINWAILHGETELGLSVHRIDAGMDTGDILAQSRFSLREDEDVGDALRKLYPLYAALTRETMAALQGGTLRGQPQDHGQATTYPQRRPEDGCLDLAAPAKNALNLVRAVARPYPGAFAWCGGQKVLFWKAAVAATQPLPKPVAPGVITLASANQFVVQCGQGSLQVLEWEAESSGWRPTVGQRFDANPPDLPSKELAP